MMTDSTVSPADAVSDALGATGKTTAPEPQVRRTPWEDPNIPVGLTPPQPRWHLCASVVAWLGWLAFLAVMAWQRLHSGG